MTSFPQRALSSIAVFAACAIVGCSGSKPAPDERVSEPPPAADEVVMPKGAPLVESDAPASEAEEEQAQVETEGAADENVVARSELERFLERGPSYVLTVVTVEPIHRDNQFQGYQITEVSRGAREFMTPQLRVGDIVTHINGVRMLRPEDFMQAWRSLDRVSTIRIDFLRQNAQHNAVWVVR